MDKLKERIAGGVVKEKLLRRLFEDVQLSLREDKKGKFLTFSASSELPVDRWWGTEILSHDKGAVRLKRANKGAMPLLFNHNIDDPIGMIEEGRIEENRLVVDSRFFDTDRAAEVQSMINGGLHNVSIAYRVHVLEENKDTEIFTATDWEPYEVSIVTIPADPSVGIGRGQEAEYEVRMVRALQPAENAITKENGMKPEEVKTPAGATAERQDHESKPQTERVHSPGADPVELERSRKRAIENLCKMNKLDDRYKEDWIGKGLSIEEVSDDILRILEERGKTNPQSVSRLGLTDRETQRFSLVRAINACSSRDWKNAPFELEYSRAIEKNLNKAVDPFTFYVPYEVMERPVPVQRDKRDLTVGTAGAGGYLVATDNVGFIEILRNRSVAFNMGVRRLSGLQGNVTIPRQSAAATAYWLSTEATAITESQQTFVQVALTPKTVGAYTEVSRLLLLQSSPSAEGIVTDDLAQVVAIGVDLAVLNGSGASGQPLGIIGTTGIGAVTGTSIAYAGVLNFQEDVAASNVMPIAGGYVTTPAVASLLMQRVKFSSTASPLWEGNLWDGTMAGFRAMSSAQVPTADMLFGDWQEAVVGEWGVLEVQVNPFADFKAGIIGIRAMYTVDVGVRRPFAFSLATSIT